MELRARLAKSEATLASIRGSDRKQRQTDALIARIAAQQQAIVDHLSNPDAEPAALKKTVDSLTDEAIRTIADTQTRDEWLQDINTALAEAHVSPSSPDLAEAIRLWGQGNKDEAKPDLRLLHLAVTEVNRVARAQSRALGKKDAEDAAGQARSKAQAEARKEGALAVGPGAKGSPASTLPAATAENIDTLYMAFERQHPDKKNPYADQYRRFLQSGEI